MSQSQDKKIFNNSSKAFFKKSLSHEVVFIFQWFSLYLYLQFHRCDSCCSLSFPPQRSRHKCWTRRIWKPTASSLSCCLLCCDSCVGILSRVFGRAAPRQSDLGIPLFIILAFLKSIQVMTVKLFQEAWSHHPAHHSRVHVKYLRTRTAFSWVGQKPKSLTHFYPVFASSRPAVTHGHTAAHWLLSFQKDPPSEPAGLWHLLWPATVLGWIFIEILFAMCKILLQLATFSWYSSLTRLRNFDADLKFCASEYTSHKYSSHLWDDSV